MTPVLRPARRADGDALAYAGFLNMAADGFFTELFGDSWQQIIARVAPVPGHELSDNVALRT